MRAVPDKVTVVPSVADKLDEVNVVPVCTALALVPFAAVEPPTVGLNTNTDFAYANEGADRPNVAVALPV